MTKEEIQADLKARIEAKREARRALGHMGKVTLLTEERIKAVGDLVAKGAKPWRASVRVGFSRRSHDRYMKKGREEDEAVRDQVSEAREDGGDIEAIVEAWKPSLYWLYWRTITESEQDLVSLAEDVVIGSIVEGDVDSAKWFLTKRASEEYGNKQTVDNRLQNASGDGDAAIAFDFSALTPEQLDAIVNGEADYDAFEDDGDEDVD